MGLRLADGIDPLLFEHRTGVALDRLIAGDARARLAAHGLIDGGQTRLKATPAGMLVLNAPAPPRCPAPCRRRRRRSKREAMSSTPCSCQVPLGVSTRSEEHTSELQSL